MQVKVASHSGFCFGVKRAINIAERSLKGSRYKGNIYSLGPIIHNPQVVNELSKKGLAVIKNTDNIKKGTVIISSHGAPRESVKKIRGKRIKLIDATCPFVKHAHNIVKDLKKQGYKIIIIGDETHPEVRALLSLAENPLTLTLSPKGKGKSKRKIGVVSQTTQNKDNYIKGILDILKADFSEVRIFNTICSDTAHRQTLAHGLLSECDVMIVVGGKNSANTRRLYQICKESGVNSYHIEKDIELKRRYFKGKRRAGVVSGASTPDAMVKKVVKKIKELT